MGQKQVPFQPLGDNLLLEDMSPGETVGGVILPEGLKEGDLQRMRVLACGSEVPPAILKAGDVVFALMNLKPALAVVEGKEYHVISAKYVMGKVPA